METEISEIKSLLKELVISQKETEKRFQETDTKFKETDKRINKAFQLFESQWGKLIESLVEGDLVKILNGRGIKVHDTSLRRKGTAPDGQHFEFDIIAHNGNEIVIVEVKTTLRPKDVEHFVDKLNQAKEWLDEYRNYSIYGAMAYLKADAGSDRLAEKENLFVIKATRNSASIVNELNFTPRIF